MKGDFESMGPAWVPEPPIGPNKSEAPTSFYRIFGEYNTKQYLQVRDFGNSLVLAITKVRGLPNNGLDAASYENMIPTTARYEENEDPEFWFKGSMPGGRVELFDPSNPAHVKFVITE